MRGQRAQHGSIPRSAIKVEEGGTSSTRTCLDDSANLQTCQNPIMMRQTPRRRDGSWSQKKKIPASAFPCQGNHSSRRARALRVTAPRLMTHTRRKDRSKMQKTTEFLRNCDRVSAFTDDQISRHKSRTRLREFPHVRRHFETSYAMRSEPKKNAAY